EEAEDKERFLKQAAAFIRMWIDDFPLYKEGVRGSVWYAYVLAIRIETWVRLHTLFQKHGMEFDERIVRELHFTTRVLLRNIEHGTMANHLMKNIKGILFAGLYFEDEVGQQCRQIALELLEREIREQFCEDGCHFERSPMYHVAMATDIMDMLELLKASGRELPALWMRTLGRIVGFLENVRHPDDEIPFFNDATKSFFIRTGDVLERGKRLFTQLGCVVVRPEKFGHFNPANHSGILVCRSEDMFLAFDGGYVGPDYQAGHAHCDTLSFELSWHGKRLITDTGVYHYKESRERTYSRSTEAHNTIRVDGVDQTSVWKSFRVGRRAKTHSLYAEERNRLHVFHAIHDGFTRIQKSIFHERYTAVKPGEWVAVVDFLHGFGVHTAESFLHFHPDCRVTHDVHNVFAEQHSRQYTVQFFPQSISMKLDLRETEYYPEFGKKLPRTSIVASLKGGFPMAMGYIISENSPAVRLEIDPDGYSVRIRDDDQQYLCLMPE
ncbi:MAG: hypothetical protein CL946_07915, partial [Ectothiorhodospiraceae bacterium]|nr:hypothetical protein [Ectothiorhodospiraceae bacterium]